MSGMLAEVLEALDAGVLVEDEQQRVLHGTGRLCTILGLSQPGPPVGADCGVAAAACASVFSDPAGFLAGIAALRAAGREVRGERLDLADGRVLERDFCPLEGGLVVWVYRDVTASARAVEDTRRAREEAERANRAQRDFLAHISHEIRTPLNAVIGMTDLALQSALADPVRGWLLRARANADALLDLLSDILDFSKIEASQVELRSEAFSPAALIVQVEEAWRPRAEARGLSLEVELGPGTGQRLLGDPGRIRQILVNLASNAVKYTHAGGVVLAARTKPDGARVSLELEVRDTGVGIDPADHKRVFERFWRARSTSSGRMSGTGLGLSITRSLARLMGGRIELESAIGAGSTFRVVLPLAPAPAARPPARVRPTAVRVRVLVADDAVDGRAVTTEMLLQDGHEVVPAEDGVEAVEIARKSRFDLLILDVDMPNLDGVEATLRIRRDAQQAGRPRVPIAALTAHATEDVRRRCLAAGMDDFVTKPVGRAALRALIARWTTEPEPDTFEDTPVDLGDLMPLFVDERRKDLVLLEAAIEAADAEGLRRVGHRMRGSAGAMSQPEISELGRELEAASRLGVPDGRAHALVERLRAWLQAHR
jgi:signal transduction histidine kinase/CheY-like chemotaxis protein